MLSKLSIGQQVRIISYEHPWCGEFVNVRSVTSGGQAGMGYMIRFPQRLIAFTIEQVCCAKPMIFEETDVSNLPQASRASHYS